MDEAENKKRRALQFQTCRCPGREQVCVAGVVGPEPQPEGRGRAGQARQRHGLEQGMEDRRLPAERAARVESGVVVSAERNYVVTLPWVNIDFS